ncbi:Undecaprenyl diphosphate synthase [Lichtheimia hyalospora FSU 10163]|nr:Undecaprenyl diphosphate synthase [Lichtheimia hyalospora FSU 10163]
MTFTTTTVTHLSPSPRQPSQSFSYAENPKIQLKSNLPSLQDLPSKTTPRPKTLYSTLLNGLCHLILYLLQLGYLLYIACRSLYRKTEHAIRQCLDTSDRLVAIQKDKARLTKIPKHLAILVSGELEERDFADWEDLVNDICLTSCWAWEFGIQELSVYDPSGILKSMGVDVYKRQSTMLHKWIKSSSSCSPALKFNILSANDGYSSLVQATQNITKHLMATGGSSDDIDIAMVDKFVHENGPSDPDLMLVCSGLPHCYISLDGFFPWHIRLTEFINNNDYHRLDYPLLTRSLYKYSKVDQRFGR